MKHYSIFNPSTRKYQVLDQVEINEAEITDGTIANRVYQIYSRANEMKWATIPSSTICTVVNGNIIETQEAS